MDVAWSVPSLPWKSKRFDRWSEDGSTAAVHLAAGAIFLPESWATANVDGGPRLDGLSKVRKCFRCYWKFPGGKTVAEFTIMSQEESSQRKARQRA